jgi:hypothetical protein
VIVSEERFSDLCRSDGGVVTALALSHAGSLTRKVLPATVPTTSSRPDA